MNSRLKEILLNSKGLKVMVIGDLILDEYIWGNIDRISPEAPVGVLECKSENIALGGAANVANNLKSIGCNVYLVGAVGKDEKGKKLKRLFKSAGINHKGVLETPDRPTTNKIRVIAHSQQILRIDREDRRAVDNHIKNKLIRYIEKTMSDVDGVICSDYGKGILSDEVISCAAKAAKKHGKMVIADPKGSDYSKYKGIDVITPNKKEASEAAGMAINGEDDIKIAASRLMKAFKGDAVLITRGAEGMSLFQGNGKVTHIPTEAKEVYDVTGAGDTVISVFGMVNFAGYDMVDAARLANIAAGIEVGKVGTSVVTKDEIIHYLEEGELRAGGKIVSYPELRQIVSLSKNKKKKIVFTNGCFDLLHIGHIKYLQQAKSYGDILIIGLNDDSSVRKLKGPKRPLIGQDERAHLIAALDCVDYVVLFSELTPERLIKGIKPDVLVKGGDYTKAQVVGRDVVESYGGRVEIVPVVEGMSTSNIVKKIMEKYS
ncbi:MAG: D-glycero-beta-D-manno-heptose-7-phosphate kinase [Nitrospinae bacterium]|nr:D-glycero-beta-D-manno-heptose-7-phosphate kinase [Nitrospinota bacterium]